MNKLEKTLKVLANQRRLAIIRYLKDGRVAPVGDIVGKIGLSFKATSKHLNLLLGADILEREQKGLQMFYKLASQLDEIAVSILKYL
jgi:DNA-binding transcriptional ArsR family regulator